MTPITHIVTPFTPLINPPSPPDPPRKYTTRLVTEKRLAVVPVCEGAFAVYSQSQTLSIRVSGYGFGRFRVKGSVQKYNKRSDRDDQRGCIGIYSRHVTVLSQSLMEKHTKNGTGC